MQILFLLFLFVPAGVILTICAGLHPYRHAQVTDASGRQVNLCDLHTQLLMTAFLSAAPLWAVGISRWVSEVTLLWAVAVAYGVALISLGLIFLTLRNSLRVVLTASDGRSLQLAQLQSGTGCALLLQLGVSAVMIPVLYVLYQFASGFHIG